MRFVLLAGRELAVHCTRMRRNDVVVHLHSRRDKLISLWVTQDWAEHHRVRSQRVPEDKWQRVWDAASWLEVAAILRS